MFARLDDTGQIECEGVVMPDKVDCEAIYLYCFASPTLVSAVEAVGVDGKNPIFLLIYRDVGAVASLVSREEFGGHSAENRMGELSWIGPLVCRHEDVVERVMLHSPVLPVRFGTIFNSNQRLEDRLKKHHDAIRHFLNAVSGKDEWAVKVLLNRARASDQYFMETQCAASTEVYLSPGALYLGERRMRSSCKEALNHWLEVICKSTSEELSRIAAELRVRKTLARETLGGGMDMVGNWAFLVSRDSAPHFCARVRAANDAVPGLAFEVSGPWPPYSFCPHMEEEVGT